ncbi:MmcQ/YjbR family DNA-binding protein [Paenibacillus senegalensis]|uniref:MmcQ/YjbR family DNA-binding protein n=1 Tax=Paenibacillus senegalensis TaxID=1465766 RepID=UPI000287E778|nr:MmcQ/YjbR family DNA-binding protein [Paenibacillus senegalensis]
MMQIEEIREIALSLPSTVEVEHWGKPSFRINNKIFVVIQDDMSTITVKTTKEERELYTSMSPETYKIPDSFSNLNYMHINLELANKDEVTDLIRNAWGIVAPKKLSKAFFES